MNFCGAVLLGCGVVLRRGGRAFCGVCLCIFFFSRRRLPSSWRMLPSAEERASAPGKRGEGRVVRDERRDGRRVVRVSDYACTLRIARRRSVPYYSSACLSVCPQAPYGLACSSTVWPCAFRHPSAAASSSANTFPFHATTITTIKECLGSMLTWSWAAVAAMRHGDGLKLEPRRRATGQPVVLLIPCEKHRR